MFHVKHQHCFVGRFGGLLCLVQKVVSKELQQDEQSYRLLAPEFASVNSAGKLFRDIE